MSHNIFMTLAGEVDKYLFYLRDRKNVSGHTLRNYRHYLKRFVVYLSELSPPPMTISSLTREHLVNYAEYLKSTKFNKGNLLGKKTRSYHLIALRQFIAYMRLQNKTGLSRENLELPEIKQNKPRIVNKEEIVDILKEPDTSDKIGLRDRAILELLVGLGLTVSELTKLDVNDFNKENNSLTIRKRSKARVIGIPDRVSIWLRRYLSIRRDRYAPLFIRFSGKKIDPAHASRELRLSARSIQRLCKKYSRRAGLKNSITPKDMRHLFAVYQLKKGYQPDKLKRLLGYATDKPISDFKSLSE